MLSVDASADPSVIAAQAREKCPGLLGRTLRVSISAGLLHGDPCCGAFSATVLLSLAELALRSYSLCSCWESSRIVDDLYEALRQADVLSSDFTAFREREVYGLPPLVESLRQATLMLDRLEPSSHFSPAPELAHEVAAARERAEAKVAEVFSTWRSSPGVVLSALAEATVVAELSSSPPHLPGLGRWSTTTGVTRTAILGVWAAARGDGDVAAQVALAFRRQLIVLDGRGAQSVAMEGASVLVALAEARRAELLASRERYLVGLRRDHRWSSEIRGALVGTFALSPDPMAHTAVLDAPGVAVAFLRSSDPWGEDFDAVRVSRSAAPELLETAAALWEPGGVGALGSLRAALRAARAAL